MLKLFLVMMCCLGLSANAMQLEPASDYVTIVITVPETHADLLREALAQAGGGKLGHYSHCTFSVKGIGRFKPLEGSNPALGMQDSVQEVIEERIETVCHREILAQAIEAIKSCHPYEETIIDIFPIYQIGQKTPKLVNQN